MNTPVQEMLSFSWDLVLKMIMSIVWKEVIKELEKDTCMMMLFEQPSQQGLTQHSTVSRSYVRQCFLSKTFGLFFEFYLCYCKKKYWLVYSFNNFFSK